jgi:hypothetical protein
MNHDLPYLHERTWMRERVPMKMGEWIWRDYIVHTHLVAVLRGESPLNPHSSTFAMNFSSLTGVHSQRSDGGCRINIHNDDIGDEGPRDAAINVEETRP